MHVRFSLQRGMPVLEEGSDHLLGTLNDIFIHPDTGVVEGFFVAVQKFLHADILFLSSNDILHWGDRIYVASNSLSPLDERYRMLALWQEARPVLGQRVRTKGGRTIGVCKDVQFDTKLFVLEWIFPKRFFRWGLPVPASAILEVTRETVIVRDSAAAAKEESPVLKALDELAAPAAPAATYASR